MRYTLLLLILMASGWCVGHSTIAATQFLVLDKTQTKDLLALITDLQKEVEELKQKVFATTNN